VRERRPQVSRWARHGVTADVHVYVYVRSVATGRASGAWDRWTRSDRRRAGPRVPGRGRSGLQV